MSERKSYDPPKLSQDEATELCVYHLRCAAALFQLVPDDANAALSDEIDRTCDEVEGPAAKAWAAVILDTYEEMKDRD